MGNARGVKAVIKAVLPSPVLSSLRYMQWLTNDLIADVTGSRDPMIPPTRHMFDGTRTVEAFKADGEEFVGFYTSLCGIKPDAKILDVGSGIGRNTLPLLKLLSDEGRYEGFDIIKQGVDWCNEKIASKRPNFRFQLADVYNKHYNPGGKYKSSEYRFPYEDNTFDLVALSSVFTHMLPADVQNYLKEIARVTKPGGKSLISWFVMNEESLKLVAAGESTQQFTHKGDGYMTVDPETPEIATGFAEEYLRGIYAGYGLKILEPIRPGSWCGRKNFLSYQDLIVAQKQ